jgi:ABC-type bacteriocin/lantibiotic exporter with double-glycine peptidase domain
MTDYKTITKEEFDAAYKLYPPNKWIKFGYKYFSKGTEMKDMYLKNILTYVLLSFFIFGFIGTILNLSRKLILIPTIIYTIAVFLFVGYMFSVVLLNNRRVAKVAKELGVTLEEYNYIVNTYYPQ